MATILPGWNSLETATKWHRGFEIAGFIALGLLLLFEVLSYIYGNRKDVLSAQQQAAIARETAKQDQARQNEAQSLRRKIDAANNAAQQAQKDQTAARHKLEQIEKATEPRRLSEQQEQELSSVLSKSPRGSLVINASVNVDDARGFADQIAGLLTRKGWEVKVNNSMFLKFQAGGHDPTGLWITVKNPESAPQRAGALQQAFKHIGIPIRSEWDPSIENPDQVTLCIGTKEKPN